MRAVVAALAALICLCAAAPSGAQTQPDIIQSSNWTCTGPQNRDLVRITMSNGSADAINFRADCSGRLGRVEVSGTFADCFKVNPVAPVAHDLLIEGGYCRVTGPPAAGVHQDCIQAGGGRDFDIRNFVFDCIGGGGGNYYINTFNGGTPQRFICTHCAFGPRHPNQIRPETSPSSGVRDSLVCQSTSGRATYLPASGNMGGNIEPAANDPRCSFEGLLAFVDDEPPPPMFACSDGQDNDADGLTDFPADPGCLSPMDEDETDPPPPPQGCDQACEDAYKAEIASLEAQIASLTETVAALNAEVDTLELLSLKYRTALTQVNAIVDAALVP